MGTPHEDPDAQANEVYTQLSEEYPEATISLEFTDRLELLVAVVLSAQCPDSRVNQVTEDLFAKYQTVHDYATVDPDELAEDIGSITYPNQKAGWITSACRQLIEEHDGEIPDTMDELTALSGVGRKTANVVLQHGHEIVEGVVVDTHVMRLAQRLGLTTAATRDGIETDLMELLPQERWQDFTHLLIAHGRAVCIAQSPACEGCVVEAWCPSSRLDHDVDLASGDDW